MRAFSVITIAWLFVSQALDAADRAPWPPPLALNDAVTVAESFVKTNRTDLSGYCLSSVRIHTDSNGRYHWDAQWLRTNTPPATPAAQAFSFTVRVHMDRTITVIPGK